MLSQNQAAAVVPWRFSYWDLSERQFSVWMIFIGVFFSPTNIARDRVVRIVFKIALINGLNMRSNGSHLFYVPYAALVLSAIAPPSG